MLDVLTACGGGGSGDSNNSPSVSYTLSTMQGAWIFYEDGDNSKGTYFVFNGGGASTHSSAFYPSESGFTYSVTATGLFTCSYGDTTLMVVQLSSATGGTATAESPRAGTLTKITDLSRAEGVWSGTLALSPDRAVTVEVDGQGTVIDSSGFAGPVTGRMFANGSGGTVLGLRMGEVGKLNTIAISGVRSGDTFTGSILTDSDDDPIAVTLTWGARYTLATMERPWIFYTNGEANRGTYFVFDGNGSSTHSSAFFPNQAGFSYTVSPSGLFTCSYGGTTLITAQLSSATSGASTAGSPLNATLTKVADVSRGVGIWSGTLPLFPDREVTVEVDANGVVTAVPELAGPVTGRMYVDVGGGTVLGLRTGETGGDGKYNTIAIPRVIDAGTLYGNFSSDSDDDPIPVILEFSEPG